MSGADPWQAQELLDQQEQIEMKSSESIKGLAASLAKAQACMENASKDTANPFFKSKYANLESVVGVIRPAIEKHGLSFVQVCHDWDAGAKVETIILHESGEWLSCGVMAAPATKADAQGFGSALTYARRYSLSAAFGVATEDDDGNAASKHKPKAEAKPNAIQESGKSVARAEYDAMPPDVQERLKGVAKAVCDLLMVSDVGGALELIDHENLDPDKKTALWSLLDAPQRTAIKAYGKQKAELAEPEKKAA